MAVSNVKAVILKDIETVCDVVTNLENYAWCSDLDISKEMLNREF